MTRKITWKQYLAAFLILAIGLPVMWLLGPDRSDGAVPTSTDDKASAKVERRAGHTRAELTRATFWYAKRGVAPWNLPQHLKGPDCGYRNPYTGNMGSCLLKEKGLSSPRLTRSDKQVISCAGQAAIAAAAAGVFGPATPVIVVSAVSTLASCAWASLN